MPRRISLSLLLCLGSLVLVACPPDEPGVDGGVDGGADTDAGGGDEDAGFDAGPQGCGDVTEQGECDGTVVRYCEPTEDEVFSYDCADRELFPDESTICSEVTDDYGVDCTVEAGGTCGFFDDEGGFNWVLCRGDEPACLETAQGINCIEEAGLCTEADEATCDGDLLTLACVAEQAYVVDCASYGGTCSDAEAACVGLPAGASCEDGLLFCADGLDCDEGVCVLTDVPDAGPGEDDAGTGDDDGGSADGG